MSIEDTINSLPQHFLFYLYDDGVFGEYITVEAPNFVKAELKLSTWMKKNNIRLHRKFCADKPVHFLKGTPK